MKNILIPKQRRVPPVVRVPPIKKHCFKLPRSVCII
jgi:hypothetical protein